MAILTDQLPSGHWSRAGADGNECIDVDGVGKVTVGEQCDSVQSHIEAAQHSLAALPRERVWSDYSGEVLVSFFIVHESPLTLVQIPDPDGHGLHRALIRGLTLGDVRADQTMLSGRVPERQTRHAGSDHAHVTMTAEIELDVWFEPAYENDDEYWQDLAERAGAAAVTIQRDDGQPIEYRWIALHAERP